MILNRRRFLSQSLMTSAFAAGQSLLPAWAQSARIDASLLRIMAANDLSLTIDRAKGGVAGKTAAHITVNGQFPAPLLRWR
jgi:hypothetical protein